MRTYPTCEPDSMLILLEEDFGGLVLDGEETYLAGTD
jgi:hypothetical protein